MELTNITINNRYRLTDKISESLFIGYYEDQQTDSGSNKVTVRIITDSGIISDDEEIIRIKHDLRIISTINHPNIMKIIEFGEIFRLPYIVMEYAPGKHLFSYLKNHDFSIEQTLDVIIQITRALVVLHGSGVVHRGLNPDRIHLCTGQSSRTVTVKLNDILYPQIRSFKGQDLFPDDNTDFFEFLSPEQLSLKSDFIDHRSDIYSLGVLFYKLITGRYPYSDAQLLISLHNNNPPAPENPATYNSRIDKTIVSIILKMLSINPDKRYSSASSLLYDLEKYRDGDRNFSLEMSTSGYKQDYRAEFSGRTGERDRLKELYNYSLNGNGCFCLVSGESGTGKSRLIEEFLSSDTIKQGVVISGKCGSGVNKEPYGLIKELLNSYIKIYNKHNDKKKNEISKTLKESLGILGEIILKLNSNMTQIIGEFPDLVRINPEYENRRFHSVAGDFFLTLAALEKPLIVLADDLQFIDEGSLELIRRICSGIKGFPMLFIGVYREEQSINKPEFFKFTGKSGSADEDYHEFNLGVLNKNDTARIVSSILYNCRDIIDEIASFIHYKSSGNPFFAIEILRGLIDEKVILYTAGGWQMGSRRLSSINIPQSITDIMIKKISLLGEMEIFVLSHASLIGASFDYDLLSSLFTHLNRVKLDSIIENCINMQFIYRDTQKSGYFHFAHEKVRGALSAYISADDKMLIHHRIASTIELSYENRIEEVIFDLANHYIECGDSAKILQYALPAAGIAAGSFANQDAIRYYSIAIHILQKEKYYEKSENLKLWIDAKKGLASLYLRTGLYDDAIVILHEFIPYIDDLEDRVLLYSMLSTAYFKKGDWILCELFAKIGIDEIGGRLPMRKRSLIFSLASEIIIHFIHLAFPFLFSVKRKRKPDRSRELMLILYENLNFMYSMKNRYKYFWVTLRILNFAEHHPGESEADVKALGLYGMLLTYIGRFRPAQKYLIRSYDIAVKLNNQYQIAVCCMYLGNNYEWQGKFEKAIEYYDIAMKHFELIGNINGVGFILNGLSSCYLNISDFERLTVISDRYYTLSQEIQNNYMLCNSLIYRTFAYLIKGDFDMAMIHARKANSISIDLDIQMPECISCSNIATIYYYINELDKAVSYFKRSISLYELNGFIKYYTFHSYPLIIEALMALYKNSGIEQTIDRKQILAEMKRYNTISLKKSSGWPTIHYYSLLSSAKYYALTGKNSKAMKQFAKSIDLSVRLGMKFETARSIYEYGLYLINLGEQDKGNSQLEFSYNLFREIGSNFYAEKIKKTLGMKNSGLSSLKIRQLVNKKKLDLIDKLILEISQIAENDKILNEFIRNASFIADVQLGTLFIIDENLNPEQIAIYGDFNYNNSEFNKTALNAFYNDNSIISQISSHESDKSLSFLFLPVKHQGKTIAFCAFGSETAGNSFSSEDIKLITVFINRISWLLSFALDQYKINPRSDEQKIKITAANEEKIKKVISYINENYMFDISREGLAALIDSNPDYFGRSFRLYTGLKISEYINKVRIEEAVKKLADTNSRVIDIALSVGFENLGTFNSAFLKIMKMNPSKYRKVRLQN